MLDALDALATAHLTESMEVNADTPDDLLDGFLFGDDDEPSAPVAEAPRDPQGGGAFPEGMSRAELSRWMTGRFDV